MLTHMPFHDITIRDDFRNSLCNLINCFSEHSLRKFLSSHGFSLNESHTVRFPADMEPFNSTRQLKMVWENKKTNEKLISPICDSEIMFGNQENRRNPFTVRCHKVAAVDFWLRRNKIWEFPRNKYFPYTFESDQDDIPKLSLLYFFKAYYDNRLSVRYLAYLLGFEQTVSNVNMVEYTYSPQTHPHAILNHFTNRFPIRVYRKLYNPPCDELMLMCHFWRRVISEDTMIGIDVLKIRP